MAAIAPSILVVEDEPAHAEAIRRAFQAAGAVGVVQVVGSLREYYHAAAAHPPDIALLDLNLPDGSAMDVLTSPPEAGPFPILVMTSYGDEHIAVEAMKAGALDYVAKSSEAFASMPRTVQRALDQWELLLRSQWAEEELQQSEQSLRHTIAELETIHASAPVAMMLMDRQWRVTKASGAAAKMAGRTEQEMIGLPCGAAIRCLNALADPKNCGTGPSCASCAVRLAILDTFATGQEHRHVDAWMPLPVGDKAENRCLLASTALLKFDDTQRVLLCVQNITDLKRSKEQLTGYQRRLRTLGAKLALAEEHERRRIAADLHDDVTQSLSLAKMKLQSLRAAHPNTAPAAIQEIEELVGRAVLSTRSLLFDLSPPPLYELGLEAAVEWLADKTQTEHKLAVSVEDDRQAKPLGEEIRGILFRAVRELLHNTVKHAHARNVGIAIRREDPFIRVEVTDDGTGVNLERPRPPRDDSGGFGLFHIRERLDYVGGRMEIHSGRDCGTRIVLLAPLQKETPKTVGERP